MPAAEPAQTAAAKLLMLPTATNPDLYLAASGPIGRDADGQPLFFDTMNPDHFGAQLLPAGDGIRWIATTTTTDIAALSGFYPFHAGAMISPDMKLALDELQLQDLEYIPLEIRHRTTGSPLAEWWFVNVFGWRDVFDLQASSYDSEEFRHPLSGFQRLEARFGERRATRIKSLLVHPAFKPNGLFLAKFPNEQICMRVFISPEVAKVIRSISPNPQACVFEEFAEIRT